MVHEIETGKTKRMSFSKIKEVIDLPDLIEIQKDSYARFLKDGLREVLDDHRLFGEPRFGVRGLLYPGYPQIRCGGVHGTGC